MKAVGRDMLQKSAQELSRGEGHFFELVITMTSVTKGDRAVGTSDDGAVGDSGAVDVATEVLEDTVAALNGLPTIDNPAFVAGEVWESDSGRGSSSQPHESAPEQARKLLCRDEELLVPFRCSDPLAIIGERTTGHEHVDMGMPLDSSCPGVQDGERANAPTEVLGVATQGCQSFKCCSEKHG